MSAAGILKEVENAANGLVGKLQEAGRQAEIARLQQQAFLGQPDRLRHVFGRTEVIFSQPSPAGTVEVHLRELPATPPAAK